VGSFQTYELSLPPVKKVKTIALKASKKKAKISSEEVSKKEEDVVAMLAKNFEKLMKNDKFKKKFSKRLKKAPKESELEKFEKKDPRGPRSFEYSSFGHIRANCGNIKQGKGKAYNATLSIESEEKKLLLKINLQPLWLHMKKMRILTTLSTVMKMGKNSKGPIKSSM
jgi:hypothetical protein